MEGGETMDHVISSLKGHLWAYVDSYRDGYSTKEELQALVKAINVLEKHHYGENQTKLETFI